MLYVTGNYSGILTHLDRRSTELEIRRGFAAFHLMTILEEARHSLILEVHDPMLFELKARLLICPRPSTLVAGREISKDFTDLWPEYIQKEANLFA